MISLFKKKKPASSIKAALVGTLLALSLGLVLVEGARWVAMVLYPADLDYAESWHAWCASQAFIGGKHVGSVFQMPYNVLPYDPLGYIVNGFTSGYRSLEMARLMGRLNSLLLTLGSGALIAAIARNLGANLIASIVGAALFVSCQLVQMFAVSLRPDALACFLTLSACFVALKKDRYLLTGVLFALAMTAKHSYIIAPGLLWLYLLAGRRFKSALLLSTSILVTLGLVATASQLLLGSWWWQGISLQSLSSGNFKQALSFISHIMTQGAVSLPFIIGFAMIFVPHIPRKVKMVSVYFLATFILNFLASAKIGAAHNYFLEPLAAGAILTGVAVTLFGQGVERRFQRPIWAALLVLFLATGIHNGISTSRGLKSLARRADVSKLVGHLRSVDGPILTTMSQIYFLANKQPIATPIDFLNMTSGSLQGAAGNLKGYVEQGYFDAIVVQSNWQTRRFIPMDCMDAVLRGYQDVGIIDGYQVFVHERVRSIFEK